MTNSDQQVNAQLGQLGRAVTHRFLHNLDEMEHAEAAQSAACGKIADRIDIPRTRHDLQELLERVYRKGFCAGVKQFAEWAIPFPPGTDFQNIQCIGGAHPCLVADELVNGHRVDVVVLGPCPHCRTVAEAME